MAASLRAAVPGTNVGDARRLAVAIRLPRIGISVPALHPPDGRTACRLAGRFPSYRVRDACGRLLEAPRPIGLRHRSEVTRDRVHPAEAAGAVVVDRPRHGA